ncbi:unnamed protein product [Caenorhabditis nigoni]
MESQPVLYDSLKTILLHMDANLRIKMSSRMPFIRAIEKSVLLKIRYLSFSDTTVDINHVTYELGVCRDYQTGDIPLNVKCEDVCGVATDFDQFGFEIPIGSSPILPGDVSFRNKDEQVMRTDTDELEQYYQTELTRCEYILQLIAEKKPWVKLKWESWRPWMSEYVGNSKERLQEKADLAREKLKPFHCRRHNLPRPFKCYIQLTTDKYGEAKPLQRLAYTRKLYEAVKQFNHILFAYRPEIRVNELLCLGNNVYRIPVGFKISANELIVEHSHIASIATIMEGDVNILRVFRGDNAENWWQHRLVKNAKELITEDFFEPEKSCLMLRTFRNRIIRFNNRRTLRLENCCKWIENWMSVKREVGSELWIRFRVEEYKFLVLNMIQANVEVIKRLERCLRIRGEHGTHIEIRVLETLIDRLEVKVEILEN